MNASGSPAWRQFYQAREGSTARSAIAQMTEICPATAILVISALNSHQTAMEAIARGACGFLVKPFTVSEVSDAIADLVKHSWDLRATKAEPAAPAA